MAGDRRGSRRKVPMSWQNVRARIYERDAGVCQVCGRCVPERFYECGHIIDRAAGGTDEDANLVVMCAFCNRMKGVHASREQYLAWALVLPMRRLLERASEYMGDETDDLDLEAVSRNHATWEWLCERIVSRAA